MPHRLSTHPQGGQCDDHRLLRLIDEGVAGETGERFFRSLVTALAQALGAVNAFVSEFDATRSTALVLAEWKCGALLEEPQQFPLAGTPCELTLGGAIVAIERDAALHYPCLTDIAARSYLAIPLKTRDQAVLGHLAVIDQRERRWQENDYGVLRIFAARAAAEIERRRFEQELLLARQAERELNRTLEARVAERTAELAASHAEITVLKNRLQHENRYLRDTLDEHLAVHAFIGESPAIRAVLGQVARVAPTTSSVLLMGESGTGKELIARAIHELSPRAGRAMIKLNCAAIASGLVESELFGHTKGAFTGATGPRSGRFELANGGTLFLDEVSELPLETQAKLLRVLQEREFERVGSTETTAVDVRIVTASNRDLAAEVAAGRFRADLYHRLHVFPIRLPPLRERRADIVLLARHFIAHQSAVLGRHFAELDSAAIALLENYPWPGNVRELANVVERAAILAHGSHLEFDLAMPEAAHVDADNRHARSHPAVPPGGRTLVTMAEMQRRHIIDILRRSGGVIEGEHGAARLLNMKPSTARYRMRKLGITRADYLD